jgi:chemotaxis protein CheZ
MADATRGGRTATEAALLEELEALGREVTRAKSEVAALRVGAATSGPFPSATDELDAVVAHTAAATNAILDACEMLEGLRTLLPAAEAQALSGAVTRIYEACSFQDVTGQRIGKVVRALQAIEARVAAAATRYGGTEGEKPGAEARSALPMHARRQQATIRSQADIDRLLASFD